MKRLVDPAEFRDSQRQPGWPITDLERAHDACGRHAAELERTGQAQHVVPMRCDFFQAKVVRRNGVEQAVVSLRVDSPEARAADIGQSRAEAIAEQAEQAEYHVAVGAGVGHDLRRPKIRLLFEHHGQHYLQSVIMRSVNFVRGGAGLRMSF